MSEVNNFYKINKKNLIKKINHILPQTQCGQCSYGGCLPYATAIVKNNAEINRCPPGGIRGLKKLAKLTHIDPTPYLNDPKLINSVKKLAIIDENSCIGCTKCITACPVDAIIGSAKQMHTVLNDYCTGCGLCIEPCPVDCITLITVKDKKNNDININKINYREFIAQSEQNKLRFTRRKSRLLATKYQKDNDYINHTQQAQKQQLLSNILKNINK